MPGLLAAACSALVLLAALPLQSLQPVVAAVAVYFATYAFAWHREPLVRAYAEQVAATRPFAWAVVAGICLAFVVYVALSR
jgi:hypothetical protein